MFSLEFLNLSQVFLSPIYLERGARTFITTKYIWPSLSYQVDIAVLNVDGSVAQKHYRIKYLLERKNITVQ